MKYVRRGLLMILILALVMPAPVVLADSENVVVENTTDVVEIIQPTVETAPVVESLSTETTATQDTAAQVFPAEDTTSPVPTVSVDSQSNTLNVATNPETNHSSGQSPSNDEPLLNTTADIVISKIRTAPPAEKYVELYNPTGQPVNLLGWKLEYMSNAGKLTVLKNFAAEHVIRPGEFLVITGKNDEANSFEKNVTMTQVLAKSGGAVRLLRPGSETSEADVVGWGVDAKWHEKQPARSGVNQLWRCFAGGAIVDSGDNAADISNEEIDGDDAPIKPGIKANCPAPNDQPEPDAPDPNNPQPPIVINKCEGLRLSEVAANVDEQFIELVNDSDKMLDISDCKLMTNRSKKEHIFHNMELAAGELLAVKIRETSLTLTKTGRGTVYVLDSGSNEIDSFDYAPMTKATSMIFRDGEWLRTYVPTPGNANNWQEFAACEPGYSRNALTGRCNKIPVEIMPEPCGLGQYRNPETGRCKKIEGAKTPAPCREGYYRSEETGRCRSIAATAAKALKPCADDQFRNPATGRCKKIAADSDVLKECAEGYERNPATNRCRKIRVASAPIANFAPEQVQQVAGATWGWWVLGGVSLLAVGYGTWQWRWEISRAARKVASIFTSRGK